MEKWAKDAFAFLQIFIPPAATIRPLICLTHSVDIIKETGPSDQELVDKVLRGNADAFSAIIKNTEGIVAQIIFKMIPNSEDRKDLAQDVYLKAFHKLQGFDFRARLTTWVAQIAYNTCLNYLQKKKLVLTGSASGKLPDEEIMETGSAKDAGPPTDRPEALLDRKERSRMLKDAMTRLSPVYRTLITLYHEEDLSYAEITQITGLPDGTVKSYLYRARKMLKDLLLLTYKRDIL